MDLIETIRQNMGMPFEDMLESRETYLRANQEAMIAHAMLKQVGFTVAPLCISTVLCILEEEAKKRGLTKRRT
jgi:hypothetical protein